MHSRPLTDQNYRSGSLQYSRPADLAWAVEFLRLSFILSGFLFFLLPGNLLAIFNWHYLGGGAEYQKIHIATYGIVFVFGLLLLLDDRFREDVLAICLTDLNLIAFAVSVAVTSFFAIVVKGVSIAPFVDTFLAALVLTVGCLCLPERYLRLFRYLLDAFFIASIAMVFFEFYTKSSILYSYGASDLGIFRATALFEGPLSAATLLGLYSLVILVSTPIKFSFGCVTRLLLSFASFSAAFATGSRTALVTVLFIAAGYVAVSLINQIRRGYINTAALLYFAVAMPLAGIVLAIFLYMGLFDTILTRFEYDFGSAFSRQVAIDLLFNMPEGDLWFGLSASDVAGLMIWQGALGLIAIEISWINFILVCGLVFTLILFATFVLFLFRFLSRYCGSSVYAPSLFLLIITAASNGIWSKTTILSTSLVIIICFLKINHADRAKFKGNARRLKRVRAFNRSGG
jgi:hypothetical protein